MTRQEITRILNEVLKLPIVDYDEQGDAVYAVRDLELDESIVLTTPEERRIYNKVIELRGSRSRWVACSRSWRSVSRSCSTITARIWTLGEAKGVVDHATCHRPRNAAA